MSDVAYKDLIQLIRDNVSSIEVMQNPPLPEHFLQRLFPENNLELHGIKAVIFDIYGTLFSSAAGDIGVNSEYSRTNLDTLALRYAEDCTGEELKFYFRNAVMQAHGALYPETPFPEVRVEEIWAEFPNRYKDRSPAEMALSYELAVNPVFPMPGAAGCLKTLGDQGYYLGIVSNAQFFTPLLFDAFFGSNTEELGFDPELCSYSYTHRRAKPAPELFEPIIRTLKNLGIQTDEAVYIGNDMLNDVFGAANCGFKTVLFAGDGRSLRLRENNRLCSGLLPDVVIRSLDALPHLIFKEDAVE